MIKLKYKDNHIELFFETQYGDIVEFNNWLSHMNNPVCFNICNDLIVNGVANLKDVYNISINYEDISQIDDFEYEALGLPRKYPYDIFLSISGSGLTDKNLKLHYSFQDFAHGNGSGNEMFLKKHRIGGYLNNDLEFLLSSNQYLLINEIEKFNNVQFQDSTSVLKEISKIQKIAVESNVVLSKTLHDTLVVVPQKVKFDISPVGDNMYKLSPIIDEINSEAFKEGFDKNLIVKSNYKAKDNDKTVRIVLDNKENEYGQSIKKELEKLKNKNIFTRLELNDIYNNPTKFWDADLIDLDNFSKRVVELGIYRPRFYPFISPYKSEWIPGIVIEDKTEGERHVLIKNKKELEELKYLTAESKTEGKDCVIFKGEKIDLRNTDSIIENAQKQLNNPKHPITTSEREREKPYNESKVLIIKENAEENEYTEKGASIENIKYNFQEIDNIAPGVKLKDHQINGVAWLQTLSSKPYSVPGVLLADDMGLGKTIQVLYFIEWFSQKYKKKPVLIVAPVSLLENWKNEYNKFFPIASLDIVTLWGSDVNLHIINSSIERTIENLSKPAIYFTTYETLRRQQIALGLIDWGIVVLDEAQKVKTPGTLVTNAAKALKADFKVAMTGTPVENSLMDLWCIIDFCSPGLLENAKEFSRHYQKPLEDENTDIHNLSTNLREHIGPTIMRRMKTDVAKDLPPINYLKYKVNMPKPQYDAYVNELNSIKELKGQDDATNPILKGILNLRSISDHPYLKHYQLEKIETKELINTSAKLYKVVEILSSIKSTQEKAIIFTENKSMQRMLRRIVKEYFNINPAIINGETPSGISKLNKAKLSRQQEIDKYQKQPGFNVIIMSPIAAGFGLNITEANHIIHYTRHWNPAKEQQATDRAYRIGQTKPVNVYYPLAVSPTDDFKTFDLILDELLQRKSQLATASLFPTERIEISRDDFLKSLDFEASTRKPSKIKHIQDLDKLSPLSFEAAIGVLIEKIYDGDAWLTPTTNDKGADIVFFGVHSNLLIQVKNSASSLGIKAGQEIKYALTNYKYEYGKIFIPMVVTNNYFTKSAIDLAEKNEVELIDRDTLNKWITGNHINTNEIEMKLNQRTNKNQA